MQHNPPYRLLLVESNETAAAPVRALLQQQGFEVDLSPSTSHARSLDLSAYALLIVDIHRSDPEGLAFVQWLYGVHSQLTGRVVVISADESEALARELTSMDVCDVVPKPVDAEEILQAVFDCLEIRPVQ